jgi:hypothetical protein
MPYNSELPLLGMYYREFLANWHKVTYLRILIEGWWNGSSGSKCEALSSNTSAAKKNKTKIY